MLFKFSVSLNQMKVFVPLLKAHFQAGLLVGFLSIYVCVYVYISRSLLSKLQSTCISPGLVKMQILPGSHLRVCVSVILRCDQCCWFHVIYTLALCVLQTFGKDCLNSWIKKDLAWSFISQKHMSFAFLFNLFVLFSYLLNHDIFKLIISIWDTVYILKM